LSLLRRKITSKFFCASRKYQISPAATFLVFSFPKIVKNQIFFFIVLIYVSAAIENRPNFSDSVRPAMIHDDAEVLMLMPNDIDIMLQGNTSFFFFYTHSKSRVYKDD
jgi:hypothetical protein